MTRGITDNTDTCYSRYSRVRVLAAALAGVAVLAGCAPDQATAPTTATSASAAATPVNARADRVTTEAGTPTPSPSASASPTMPDTDYIVTEATTYTLGSGQVATYDEPLVAGPLKALYVQLPDDLAGDALITGYVIDRTHFLGATWANARIQWSPDVDRPDRPWGTELTEAIAGDLSHGQATIETASYRDTTLTPVEEFGEGGDGTVMTLRFPLASHPSVAVAEIGVQLRTDGAVAIVSSRIEDPTEYR